MQTAITACFRRFIWISQGIKEALAGLFVLSSSWYENTKIVRGKPKLFELGIWFFFLVFRSYALKSHKLGAFFFILSIFSLFFNCFSRVLSGGSWFFICLDQVYFLVHPLVRKTRPSLQYTKISSFLCFIFLFSFRSISRYFSPER